MPPSRARAWIVGAAPGVAVVVVLGAVGSYRAFVAAPATARRSLAIVGDSITASSQAELTAEAAGAGWEAAIDATPGAMTLDKREAAEHLASAGPAAAVIHLGTNDSLCVHQNRVAPGSCRVWPYTAADRDRDLAAMAAGLRVSGACVIGVVPFLDLGVGDAWARLRAEGTAQGVADWRAEAEAHHGEYLVDELGHLSEAGRKAYARFVLAAVDDTCAGHALGRG